MPKFVLKMRWFVLGLALAAFSGCGYTSKTKLPRDIQSIYIETVLNKIPIEQMYSYQPGLEMDITNAVIQRLQVDGNLKVVSDKSKADAILSTDLKAYEQEGVRFNSLEGVSEFRLFIVLALTLTHRETEEVLWAEPNFSGNDEYFVTEVRSMGQRSATTKAIDDLAKKVVDRITEDW